MILGGSYSSVGIAGIKITFKKKQEIFSLFERACVHTEYLLQ